MASPKRESGVNPMSTRGDPPKVLENQQRRKDDEREFDKDSSRPQYGRDSHRHADRYSSKNSHGYSTHDEYSRREICADEQERRYKASSRSIRPATHSDLILEESEHGTVKSRDFLRNDDKYSRDKYDSSKHTSKDKETESASLDRQKFRDLDVAPDSKKDRDRHDRNSRDEKKDYHRTFGDHRSDRASSYVGSKGYRSDSSGLHHEGLHFRESYKDGKKHNDLGSKRDKDRRNRALQNEDKTVSGFENQESLAKKSKTFSSDKNANEKQKQVYEVDGKVTGQIHVNNSEAANDLNAAKVAAMKAAELVNKNLGGVGFMSTEQKKKLLWGNKKSTTSQESGNRWDTPLFDDRERQEKFNKLMGVKGDLNVEHKPETEGGDGRVQAEKQKEVQMDLEKQYTAGLRRRDGRTVGLGL